MESKHELKEINIKNCACFYFENLIRVFNFNFDNTLLEEKLYENISVYGMSYKALTGPKPLCIRHHKIDGFIRVCGGKSRYLALFDHGFFDKICDKIKYLISGKSGITDSINHNFGKIRIEYYNSLLLEKLLTFPNVIIFIKSVVNKNKNECYYNIFLEKRLVSR